MDGIGCASNGARSHGRCVNQETCVPRPFARRWPSARLVTRDIRTKSKASALQLLADAEDGESFVRTFTYTSGPAYGLLLDAASRGWTRTVRGSDDPVVLLM